MDNSAINQQPPSLQNQPTPQSPDTGSPAKPFFHPNVVAFLLLVVLVVAALGAGGYLLVTRTLLSSLINPSVTPQSTPRPSPESIPSATANWKTYRNDKYMFEIRYPATGWLLTNNVRDPILAWADKPIKPLDIINLYTQRDGNPETDELSTTITFSVFQKAANLSMLEWLSSAIPDMPKAEREDLNMALKRANAGKEGLLAYTESKNNDIEISKFGVVALPSIFDYATYLHKIGSPYVYSIELTLPLRVPGSKVTDTDEQYIDIYNQILSTFKFLDENTQSEDTVSCKNIDLNPPELTFEAAYCIGGYCDDAKTKSDCESRDIIKVVDNKIISGKDGRGDCRWDTNQNFCFPNR